MHPNYSKIIEPLIFYIFIVKQSIIITDANSIKIFKAQSTTS